MDKFQNKYNTKSNRLKEYDYSQPAWYFVTICTKDKAHHFGKICNAKPKLSPIGEITQTTWFEIPNHFPNVEIDEFTIMPNHVHGIIIINERRATACCGSTKEPEFGKIIKGSLGVIVRSFKSAVTKRVNEMNEEKRPSIWQSNYYDNIIRNERDLDRIRKYIKQNPRKWELDEYYKL